MFRFYKHNIIYNHTSKTVVFKMSCLFECGEVHIRFFSRYKRQILARIIGTILYYYDAGTTKIKNKILFQ